MATHPESWDADPDFSLPSGPLSLPLPSLFAGLSSAAPPPLPSPSSAHEPERGFFDDLDAQLVEGGRTPKTREEENASSVDSSRTSTTTGTLMGLMEGLSLGHDQGDITLSFDGPPSPAAPPEIVNTAATPRTKQQVSRMTTLRPGSSLSQLLSTHISSKVHHLGSTRRGAAKEVGEGDWDQDLDIEGIDALGLSAGDLPEGGRRVGKKGSWTSHISVEDDEDEPSLSRSPVFPSTSSARSLRKQISIASFKDDIDDISDADFDLPSSQAMFEISPALTLNRPSMSSLRSVSIAPEEPHLLEGSSSSTPAPRTPTSTPANLPPPSSRLLTASPALSTGTDLAVLTDSDSPLGDGHASSSPNEDLDFFEDLELPPYFLGGSGQDKTLTPPTSEGEPDAFLDASSPDKRVDLQAVLRAKLEQRGGRGLLFGPAPGSPTPAASLEQQEGLLKHREEAVDEFDVGKELSLSKRDRHEEGGEENWTVEEMRERMRTISGARAREVAVAKAAGRGGPGRRGGMRRAMSEGKVPKSMGHPGRSSTSSSVASIRSATSTGTVKGGLNRTRTGASPVPVSSSSSGITARSSLPQPTRPASAQGAVPSSSSSSTRRAGPPPAPSTASRDRVRLRTISLRTVGSSSDLRISDSTAAGRRPPKLNLDVTSPAGEKGKGRSLSPVPITPATPALRTKCSQLYLGPSPPSSSSRTLERKRSLQNLSSHSPQPTLPPPSSSRPSSRQLLRSPSPAPRPSFAAPTAASSSRVRERVQSNPHPPAAVPPSPNVSATRTGGTGRLLQPTLSSASKSRSPSKPSLVPVPRTPSNQTPHPHLARLRLPSHSLHLSRPFAKSPSKREPIEYGDGTELDGFDDLPVSKERERRSVSRASSAGKGRTVSGGSTASTVKGGSWGKASAASVKKGPDDRQGKSLKPTGARKEGAAEKGKEKEKQQQQGKKKRREPHLIRHLGASATKVHGEMTYNPQLQRWEGNESILREFDKVLSTSVRPALISPFSSTLGSPARQSFLSGGGGNASSGSLSSLALDPTPSAAPAKPLPSAAAPRGAAKVVGDMVFDPATCSWHALAGADAEDELEFDLVDWGSAGDFADDEDGDGWAAGERERLLKNRASFVLSEGEEDDDEGDEEEVGSTGGGRAKQTRRGIWRESKRAEERCRAEMRGWVQSPRRRTAGEVEGRAWLFELRALIVGSR
ncbi:hypothetical protein JCM21900_005035 [Sporobolomyces salmonicolor]